MRKFRMITLATFMSTGIATQAIPQLTVKVLDNGLTVILHEDHRNPKVFGTVITKAGGKDDPWDATGLAHYMEHMLFKGTTELGTSDWDKEKPLIDKIFQLYDELGKTTDPKIRENIQQQINEVSVEAGQYTILNELSNLVYRMGGTNLNAFTSPDITVFFNEFPPNQITRWLDLYAHRFQNPVFRAFQSELEVVYEEKNMYEDQFQTKLIENFNRYFFKKHPYGQRTLIGSSEDLKNPSLTKMAEFYKTWYLANNMALILVGDFNTEEVWPVIQDKFGKLPSGKVPERQKYVEEPFKGREVVEVKLTPIRFNLLGFRIPTEKNPDKQVVDIIARMLNNPSHTGYLDQLAFENKLLAAYAIPLVYHDYGAFIIVTIPKLLGQKFEEAENLVIEQLKRIAQGEFSPKFLETIKNELYREEQLKFESLQELSLALAFAFAQDFDPTEVFNRAEHIKIITVDDIKRVATTYFGENYLCLQSKIGSAPKDKVNKPNYKPISTNTTSISKYQQHFLQIQPDKYHYKPIDFKADIQHQKLDEQIEIFCNTNPLNDIYSLRIQFGVGTRKLPMLEYAINYMNMCGLENMAMSDLKLEFAKLGTNYSFEVDEDFTTIFLQGIEQNLPKALALINRLMNEPYPDDTKIAILYENTKAAREVEKKQPDDVAYALFQYALYGKNSKFINRPSLKQIKKLKASQLIDIYRQATQYSVKIFYTGQQDISLVSTHVKNNLRFRDNLQPSESPGITPPIQYNQNQIFFVNKKKASQAKIFLSTQANLTPEEYALMEAFNIYIGGGFSGILIQEIREYRSMAYAVGGGFRFPKRPEHPVIFTSFVGTQVDKTIDAVEILYSLLTNLPEKPERMELIKDYLVNKSISNKPDFRNLIQKYEDLKYLGYNADPTPILLEKYQQLTWNDLYEFYKRMIQSNRFVLAIAGDKAHIDLNAFKKIGKLIEVHEKDIFVQ